MLSYRLSTHSVYKICFVGFLQFALSLSQLSLSIHFIKLCFDSCNASLRLLLFVKAIDVRMQSTLKLSTTSFSFVCKVQRAQISPFFAFRLIAFKQLEERVRRSLHSDKKFEPDVCLVSDKTSKFIFQSNIIT